MAKPNPWTEAEEAVIREYYPKLKRKNHAKVWAELLARVPGRSKFACQVRANRLGIVVKKPWTEEEDDGLRQRWSDCSASTILRYLPGRSWNAVLLRAKNLGLEGRWQGFMSLRVAANVAGYSVEGLQTILDVMHVPLQHKSAVTRSGKRSGVHKMVEYDEVVEAIENYNKLETPRQAGERWGVPGSQVAKWVLQAGLRAPKSGVVIRFPPETLDALIGEKKKTYKPRPRRKKKNGRRSSSAKGPQRSRAGSDSNHIGDGPGSPGPQGSDRGL